MNEKQLVRLMELHDLLAFVPRENFHMQMWGRGDLRGKAEPKCGTTCCAFGWATAITPGLRLVYVYDDDHGERNYAIRWRGSSDWGTRVYGISRSEAMLMFMSNYRSRDPALVQRRIRKVIAKYHPGVNPERDRRARGWRKRHAALYRQLRKAARR